LVFQGLGTFAIVFLVFLDEATRCSVDESFFLRSRGGRRKGHHEYLETNRNGIEVAQLEAVVVLLRSLCIGIPIGTNCAESI
jgi:hypothetical protein